jgi:hypothetical protein
MLVKNTYRRITTMPSWTIMKARINMLVQSINFAVPDRNPATIFFIDMDSPLPLGGRDHSPFHP